MCWGQESQRFINFADERTPAALGPGAYTIKSQFGEKEKHIFEKQKVRGPEYLSPGPAFYQTTITTQPPNQPKSSAFASRTIRSIPIQSGVPDPGFYGEICDWVKKKDKPTSTRRNVKRKAKTPKPVLGNHLDDKGNFVFIQPEEREIGPVTYNPSVKTRVQTPDFNWYSSNRDHWDVANNVPGPTQYEIKNVETKLKPKIKEKHIAKENENNIDFITPPEAMKPKKNTVNFRRQTSRKIYENKNCNPGPGAYYKDGKTTTWLLLPGVGFNQSAPRFANEKSGEYPGPGDYTIKSSRATHTHTLSREFTERNHSTPEQIGPGYYEPYQQFQKYQPESAVFKAKGRTPEKIETNDGTYYTPREKIKGKRMFSTRYPKYQNFSYIENLTPASCDYETNVQTKKVGPKISSSKHEPLAVIQDTPGPGAYNISKSSLLKRSYNVCTPFIDLEP